MTTRIPHLVSRCQDLVHEGRCGEAVDLLDRGWGAGAENDPAYWQWKGALLLWAGRHQEAEAVLRGAERRPRWPLGHAGITCALAEVMSWSGRFVEIAELTEPWARDGDLSCVTWYARALLSLGRPSEALRRVEELALGSPGHVGLQLVVLEAYLDLGACQRDSLNHETAARVLGRLQNMQRAGLNFSPYEVDQLAKLRKRFETPFGFNRR